MSADWADQTLDTLVYTSMLARAARFPSIETKTSFHFPFSLTRWNQPEYRACSNTKYFPTIHLLPCRAPSLSVVGLVLTLPR